MHARSTLARWLVAVACLVVACASTVSTAREPGAPAQAQTSAQSAPPTAVAAARAADKVAIITIHQEIDGFMAESVLRRLKEAEQGGARAVVIDLDTPGGELSAMLNISGAIKRTSIPNTVAWVNPRAISAGSVIALACREIVVNEAAILGDALPVEISMLGKIQVLGPREYEKILGPVMADLIESARRNGQDEMLVQGFVRQGVELWWVQHTTTGQRLFVTAEQYRLATGEEPRRDRPAVPSVTGPVDPKGQPTPGESSTKNATSSKPGSAGSVQGPVTPIEVSPGVRYQPAAPSTSPALQRSVDQELSLRAVVSARPDLASAEHKGQYTFLRYVADGSGVLTLTSDDMVAYRLAQAKVRTDDELKAYFGAKEMVRLEQSWSEHLVRFLSNPLVKGLLIVIFLIAVFVEMTHPGVALPGVIAAGCLIALIVPPLLINLSAWWALAAILGGLVLIAVELFLAPGVGVFALTGVVLLFAGLVGTFTVSAGGIFPSSSGGSRSDLMFGAATTLISMIVAGVGIGLLARHLPRLPGIGRLVLQNTGPGDTDPTLTAAPEPKAAIGSVGVAVSTLRPSGRVSIGDDLFDATAEMGFIPAGAKVRVVSSDAFGLVVALADEPAPGNS